MNICFRQPVDWTDLRMLADFLWRQHLGYSGYDDWIQRAVNEIDGGYKQSILAFDGGRLVGDVVYQPHKEISGVREIKNLRVDESIRCRKFGAFLLRQAEWQDSAMYDFLMADFRADQPEVESLMLSEGYRVVETRNLYGDGVDKVVLKPAREKNAWTNTNPKKPSTLQT